MRFPVSLALCLVVLQVLVRPAHAYAQPGSEYGATASGLCGLVHTGSPVCGRGTTLSASAGYGATLRNGRHDRALGSLGVAHVPLSWLALSLELAGRIDLHPRDALGRSVTATGDPIVRVRAGYPVGTRGLSLGAELELWLPGRDAPSFRAQSISPALKLLLAFKKTRWQSLALAGVRIDQSFNSAPDLERLREVDRVTLGLSDSHALLLGAGLGYLASPALTVFGELSADLLLGKQAPPLLESPLRLALGARYFVLAALQVELAVHTSLSQRPSLAPADPLVPIEPRVAVLAGLRATFGMPKPKLTAKPSAEPTQPSTTEVLPPLGSLAGVLTDPEGAPLPEVRLKLTTKDGQLETITDAQGRFSFEQLHAGKAELSADAAGFLSAHRELEIAAARTELPPWALEPGESTGILRFVVRSFESTALKAQVTIRDLQGKRIAAHATDASGSLEFALPPGEYRVIIDVAGYRSQRTQVQVAANQVAILNVDMRKIE